MHFKTGFKKTNSCCDLNKYSNCISDEKKPQAFFSNCAIGNKEQWVLNGLNNFFQLLCIGCNKDISLDLEHAGTTLRTAEQDT